MRLNSEQWTTDKRLWTYTQLSAYVELYNEQNKKNWTALGCDVGASYARGQNIPKLLASFKLFQFAEQHFYKFHFFCLYSSCC